MNRLRIVMCAASLSTISMCFGSQGSEWDGMENGGHAVSQSPAATNHVPFAHGTAASNSPVATIGVRDVCTPIKEENQRKRKASSEVACEYPRSDNPDLSFAMDVGLHSANQNSHTAGQNVNSILHADETGISNFRRRAADVVARGNFRAIVHATRAEMNAGNNQNEMQLPSSQGDFVQCDEGEKTVDTE